MEQQEKKAIRLSLMFPVYITVFIWAVFGFEVLFGVNLESLGVRPRELSGLWGIICMPFIHADFGHIFSNTVPLVVLMYMLLIFYRDISHEVLLLVTGVTGVLIWAFARGNSVHIGMSGILYALVAFLFFSGVFRKDFKSIGLALLVVFLYGGMVWGILPLQPHISWEGHLFGALSGILAAYVYRTAASTKKKYDWEDEPSETPARELKVDPRKEPPF